MRKFLKRFLIGLGLCVLVAGVGLLVAYRATQRAPDFYERVLVMPPNYEGAADDLERNVLELRNDVHKPGPWKAVFAESEVNSWLATDLKRDFPEALPPDVEDPRVAIEKGQLHFACRYVGNITSVISLSLDVQVTDQPNVLMVRVDRARAGSLPIPFKRFMEDITDIARKSEIGLRWTDQSGDPVAIVTIPEVYDAGTRFRVEISSIKLEDGKLHCYGKTVEDNSSPTLNQP